jgi:hypothetical protein
VWPRRRCGRPHILRTTTPSRTAPGQPCSRGRRVPACVMRVRVRACARAQHAVCRVAGCTCSCLHFSLDCARAARCCAPTALSRACRRRSMPLTTRAAVHAG